MAKRANLINYAHLNDRDGDLTRSWYVEWSYRVPDTPDKTYRFRSYYQLGKGTAQERKAAAAKIITLVNNYLKSGEYLKDPNYNPVKPQEDFRPEAQAYLERADAINIRKAAARFMKAKKQTLRKKSYMDYRGKLSGFVQYVERELKSKPITQIKRAEIVPFFEYLGTERKLTQKSIEKYMQVVRMFFAYMEDIGLREYDTNPVVRIPKFGKVIECQISPFTMNDRERLKAAIAPREPYLWLACEIQYYCAIRPGTELRLAKVGMIDRRMKTITVPGSLAKNKKTESVGIPDVLMAEMERLGIFNYPDDYYIFGRWGIPAPTPTGKNTLRNRFNQYRTQLHISKDKKFYSWKHTGAVAAAENGMPLLEMKDGLRHSEVTTTMEYIKKRSPALGTQAKYLTEL